ncbi:substrate-binding domain-containing protein [Streptomyces purpurogeneiscleroticus]|uniref:substrate-binding domain-containing protein n=1 Tax=Streptomyces purpurogeneiscleroticus TaxID=68259 RepID=UPI001CBADE84|nr:substrate-binding domain-containing protein [Streptomyces purpurogeneiscleroticus]MBZ4018572.1 ABC transporter substrate-binding protein [Streptomyces purpurogeneiscleroticus]
MKIRLRVTAVAMTAVSLAFGLAGCGKTGQPSGPSGPATGKGGMKIGLLLPDNHTPRWETFDRPLIEKKIKELCGNCTVEYANAEGDVATQQHQVDAVISRGVNVLILSSVDATSSASSVEEANAAHIPVVSYDHLARGPISGYVSFDARQVGRLQAHALLEAMGHEAANGRQIVMMNGDPSDPNTIQFKKGALSVLKGAVRIGKAYDTVGWRPENANANMSGAIAALGADSIDGVYAANDGLARGVISALKAAKIKPLPPVTGQDAELAAVQRIVSGEQYMTVYKPFRPEADAAAEMAVALGRGEKLDRIATSKISGPSGENIPAVLLTPVSATLADIKDTVVKDGMYTVEQICTDKYKAACDRAGLTH